MRGFKKISTVAAIAMTAGLFASSALAQEAPPPASTYMTPVPQAGVRIVLPSGKVVILPIEPDVPMTPGANRDHIVGDEIC